jgi:hypothetical protein
MTTLEIVFALIGAAIPPVVIVQAFRSKARDRWPEGVLVGVYLGVLGSISVIALLAHFLG